METESDWSSFFSWSAAGCKPADSALRFFGGISKNTALNLALGLQKQQELSPQMYNATASLS